MAGDVPKRGSATATSIQPKESQQGYGEGACPWSWWIGESLGIWWWLVGLEDLSQHFDWRRLRVHLLSDSQKDYRWRDAGCCLCMRFQKYFQPYFCTVVCVSSHSWLCSVGRKWEGLGRVRGVDVHVCMASFNCLHFTATYTNWPFGRVYPRSLHPAKQARKVVVLDDFYFVFVMIHMFLISLLLLSLLISFCLLALFNW